MTPVAEAARPVDLAAPLETLWEQRPEISGEVRGAAMPVELERRYGGQITVALRPDRPTVISNFVSTLDGIVAFGSGELSGGGLVSGFHEPDRFVMGVLRSLADVVIIGAGTLRGSTGHRWTPGHVHPASEADFATWRRAMGLRQQPTTVIVTASGEIPVDHPGLTDPTIPVAIVTTATGAARLDGADLAPHVDVRSAGSTPEVSAAGVVKIAEDLGARLVLTEGGPHVMGGFVEADLLDEAFLTVAPQLVGRGDPSRLGLLEGIALPPPQARWLDLASVRRSGDHLFLRYARDARRGSEPAYTLSRSR